MCALFTFKSYFHPSASSTSSVRADASCYRKTSAVVTNRETNTTWGLATSSTSGVRARCLMLSEDKLRGHKLRDKYKMGNGPCNVERTEYESGTNTRQHQTTRPDNSQGGKRNKNKNAMGLFVHIRVGPWSLPLRPEWYVRDRFGRVLFGSKYRIPAGSMTTFWQVCRCTDVDTNCKPAAALAVVV